MKQLPLALTLALLAVLAGCGGLPTDTPETTPTPAENETVEVRMTGNSSATYVVAASLVADPDSAATVTYANGTNRTVSVSEDGAVTLGPESGATDVEPREETVSGVYFEGSPKFTVTANDVPATRNLVYSVRRKGEDRLASWGLIRCDGHVSDLSLVANESGLTDVGFACEP